MKIIKYLIVILVLIFGTTACIEDFNLRCKKADGPIRSETRDVAAFTRVSNLISGDIFIRQGATQEVRVSARENILGEVETRVVNGELHIELEDCIRGNGEIQIFITIPQIEGIELVGSGNITGENFWSVNDLDVRLIGSGNINLTFDASNVETFLSGSGDIDLSGSADDHRVTISGSGDIQAFELHSLNTNATISGSGDMRVRVAEQLDAKISGSGDIFYKGDPTTVNSSVSGSGNVSKVN